MEAFFFWIDATLAMQLFLNLGGTICKFCEKYRVSENLNVYL